MVRADKKLPASANHDWKVDSEEEFVMLGRRFDVQRAKQIIVAAPREVYQVVVADVSILLASRPGKAGTRMVLKLGISVDWGRVESDDSINLEDPIILATMPSNSHLPIDGYHRIARAAEQGVETLPCVLLSAQETAEVRGL